MKIFSFFVAFCLLVGSCPVLADEGMDTRISVKVNRAKRQQMMKKHRSGDDVQEEETNSEDPCKGVEIGNVYTDGRQSRIRENIVIVTGDVISVPSRKCR